ncbi:hypothetical protein M3J09_009202 [Ascochyta lentis]
MLMGAPKSPTTTKRPRRSTSPRAIELRRLQNRIAQRNHRRRVREQARQETDDTSLSEETHANSQKNDENTSSDTQSLFQQEESTGFGSDSREGQTNPRVVAQPQRDSSFFCSLTNDPETMIMADDMVAQHEQNMPYIEMMMRSMPDKENRVSQPSLTFQGCTCNATTGPCPNHLEKIRAQLLSETTSPLQVHQQHQEHQSHHVTEYDTAKPHAIPPSPISHYSQSTSSGGAGQQSLYFPQGSAQMRQNRQTPAILPHINKFSSSISNQISPPRYPSPAILSDIPPEPLRSKGRTRAPTTSAAENTRRFGIVLDAMRTAGFQDFDGMAVEYYTARFEVGSLPAMAQCASRSRRMRSMLQELHESSRQWPRWESRGLHESVSEATVSLCLDEMERLNKMQMLDRTLQSDPANLITAFEWLLETNGQGNMSIIEELSLSGNIQAAPDEMPYLWSLLTELAGSRGLYCDRIARIVMVILLYARRT